MVAAVDLTTHVDFGFLAADAFLEGSNLGRHPSDRLVQVVDACIVALDAGGLDVVDSPPAFVKVTESSGHEFGMEQLVADIVPETWKTVVAASHVPRLTLRERSYRYVVVAVLVVCS